MAEITAALVKELRAKSGVGMMDCKKALQETDGDINAAIDWLRAKGLSKAAKKADRVAAEGLIAVATKEVRSAGESRRRHRVQRGNRLRRPQRSVPGRRPQAFAHRGVSTTPTLERRERLPRWTLATVQDLKSPSWSPPSARTCMLRRVATPVGRRGRRRVVCPQRRGSPGLGKYRRAGRHPRRRRINAKPCVSWAARSPCTSRRPRPLSLDESTISTRPPSRRNVSCPDREGQGRRSSRTAMIEKIVWKVRSPSSRRKWS
jgi:hypothetical protein